MAIVSSPPAELDTTLTFGRQISLLVNGSCQVHKSFVCLYLIFCAMYLTSRRFINHLINLTGAKRGISMTSCLDFCLKYFLSSYFLAVIVLFAWTQFNFIHSFFTCKLLTRCLGHGAVLVPKIQVHTRTTEASSSKIQLAIVLTLGQVK